MIDKTTKAAIRERMGITIPLRDSRPSTTRSDAFSGSLHETNLGIPRMVAELESMLSATMIVKRLVKIADGDWQQRDFEIIDWKTRSKAVEMLITIHGYVYAPQKAQDQDPLVVVINTLPEQVREKLLTTIKNRLAPLTSEGHES